MLLDGPGHENARILNADLWGGYLIYKLDPSRHLFIDGRSDYFGPKVVKDYVACALPVRTGRSSPTVTDLILRLYPPTGRW